MLGKHVAPGWIKG